MTVSGSSTYVIVPLHLISGLLFGLLPNSPYQAAYYGVYGVIAIALVLTVIVYGMLVRVQKPSIALVWVQCGLALAAATVPFFTLDFSDVWHILMYPLIMGGSLFACLLVGNVVLLTARN